MIKVKRVESYDQKEKLVTVVLYADDKTDFDPVIENEGEENEETIYPTIYKMPIGYDLDCGSWCCTETGVIGILDSEGVWHWSDEGE